MAWSKHVRRRGASIDELGRRLRRLRRRGAGVQLERLQGRRRQGQDDRRARQRSAVPDPADPSKLDPKMFGGKAMTYYGRWTYKFEEGARKGAAAVLDRARDASRPAIRSPSCRATCARSSTSSRPTRTWARANIEGWITLDAARKLFDDGRPGLRRAEEAGARRATSSRCRSASRRRWRSATRCARSTRSNVVAKLEGSDPALKDEYVVYSAHWDHLGIGAPVNGDKIYNGALDNASGVGDGARDRAGRSRRCSRSRSARSSS